MIEQASVWLRETSNYVAVERLLDRGWIACRQACVWQPPTDAFENEGGLVVRVDVAGVRSGDFSISLVGRTLVIAGTRVDPAPGRMVHQMEIRFGEFRTEDDVPWQVYPEDVEASYEDGFLQVRLSRPRSRRVAIAKPGED